MNDIAEYDHRSREQRDGEYTIVAFGGVGRIVCYRPGMKLIDFYRTTSVLAKDTPKKEQQ